MELVVANDHAGLRAAIREVLPEAAYQRCYVHFLRNALDHLPRKADDDGLQELRWLYDRRSVGEAARSGRLDCQVGGALPAPGRLGRGDVEETLTFYRLPRQHHKHLKSTNMLERLNEEIRRRTYVVRIFPMRPPAAGWCGRWRWRRMRTGSRPIATSTWTTSRSTRKINFAKPLSQPVQPPRFAELDAHNLGGRLEWQDARPGTRFVLSLSARRRQPRQIVSRRT